MPIEVKPDPEDGLPALEAGEWAEEKHELLRQYLDYSHPTRRKFVNGSGGATYIELFSGPGRIFFKGTNKFNDGSPLVAHAEAARTQTVFSSMYLGDELPEFGNAVSTRLTERGAHPSCYTGRAEDVVWEICKNLNPYGLHFAFLDPFDIESLPLTIIEALAGFKHMDILTHVSAMDLQRNLPKYAPLSESPFDSFAPDWRQAIKGHNPSDITARAKFLEHWLSLIRKAGFEEARGMPLIKGPQNQPLYWLVLIAKHKLARKFWDSIAKRQQRTGDLFQDGS